MKNNVLFSLFHLPLHPPTFLYCSKLKKYKEETQVEVQTKTCGKKISPSIKLIIW